MSRIITNTNILVDDFDFAKSFPKKSFVHFLTHFHSDHYQGLSPLWDYGDIHCTHQTKKFILNKYPKIQNIYSYDYYKPCTLELGSQKLKVTFYFFDAKHIPGSAMILFQGYMGSILVTGDFRYQYQMVQQNQILFPLQKRLNHTKKQIVQKMQGISLHIDQMIFDNTYCNKVFDFQTQSFIAQKIINIISKNSDKKLVLIAMGALGKHKIILKIAQHFQTNIIVSQKQFQKIQVAGLRTDFLTTNQEEGFIKLISKKRRAQIIQQIKKGVFSQKFICIDTDFLMLQHQSPDQINYIVPYSLHSNYEEMKTLIRMIKPCILRKLVIPYSNFKQIKLRLTIDHRLKFSKYLDFLQSKLSKSQSGYSDLVRYHTQIYELSQSFLKWFSKKNQKYLMESFGLGNGQQNHNLRKRKVVLLSQDELQFKSNSQSRSLKSIADELNAVNKNLTLQKCVIQGKQRRNDRKYQQKLKQYAYKEEIISLKNRKNTYFNQDTAQQSLSVQLFQKRKEKPFQFSNKIEKSDTERQTQ